MRSRPPSSSPRWPVRYEQLPRHPAQIAQRLRQAPAGYPALARSAPHRAHRRGLRFTADPRHAAQGPPPRRGAGVMSTPKDERKPTDGRIGLHNLKPAHGSRRPRKRVGRGEGSGTGKTSGRGQKGYGSRSGAKQRARVEGGQNPIHMRLRKLRGPHMKKSMAFENFRTKTQPINLADLEERFDSGAEV